MIAPPAPLGVALAAPALASALAERFGGTLDAEAAGRELRRVLPAVSGGADDALVPLWAGRHRAAASQGAGLWLVSPALAGSVPPGRRWVHAHPAWVVARLLGERPEAAPTVMRGADDAPDRAEHPGAVIHRTARLEDGVLVGRGTVIHADVRVGAGSVLGEGSVVYSRVTLGQRVVVGALSVLGRPGFGWVTGPDGEVVRMPQLGGVVIADDVELGPLCTVDAGTLGPTRLGPGAKLDAHVHVGHNAEIGAGCLVAAQGGFAGSSVLGAGTLMGGQSGLADGVRVGRGARIAARTGVIGDVPDGSAVAGFPAVEHRRWLRANATLLRLTRRKRP